MAAAIIRILGGPHVEAQADLKQQPCSIVGLSQLTDVDEADLIILCWENTIGTYDYAFGDFGHALSQEHAREVKGRVKTIWDQFCKRELHPAMNRAEQWQLETDNWPRPTCYLPPDLLRKVVDNFMAQVWTAVRGGAMAFLILPDHIVGHEKGKFGVADILKPLEVAYDPSVRPPVPNADLQITQHDVRTMAGKLAAFIEKWPHFFAIRGTQGAGVSSTGETSCRVLCPAYVPPGRHKDDVVQFFPAVLSRQGDARALVMQHGAGALFVIPPPRSLDALIQAYEDVRRLPSGPSAHEEVAQPAKDVPAKSTGKKRGPKVASKEKRDRDKEIFKLWKQEQRDAMNSGARLTIEHFLESHGEYTEKMVKQAIDRQRKREG